MGTDTKKARNQIKKQTAKMEELTLNEKREQNRLNKPSRIKEEANQWLVSSVHHEANSVTVVKSRQYPATCQCLIYLYDFAIKHLKQSSNFQCSNSIWWYSTFVFCTSLSHWRRQAAVKPKAFASLLSYWCTDIKYTWSLIFRHNSKGLGLHYQFCKVAFKNKPNLAWLYSFP